ncbi:major facilitator superfamily domain-containing protein 2B-like [Branchiostoma floridae]|uniref:Major facilitator superfamily domain-containing protein 2B-like n=1 Tax=Branchiostoma floridae TaxID=7739 RepID=A0A9J7MPQ3_BRAFL|nr:major facilitator superfamily domain-containing protein 2B-like [Branchiostoma floridae]
MAGVRVEPLSTREKLCYAVGEFSGVMTYDIISLYANIFLLEVVKLTPLAATAVIFGSRVWDVLAYPLLIPVLNATRPNKWGKHKTWMAASTLIVIPSYVLGWYVPGIDSGGKVAWYLVFYSVYLVSQTAYTISHRTLLMYMTEVPAERDSATTYRMICHMLSYLLAIGVHGQIVAAFGTTESASCVNSTISNTSTAIIADPETGYLVSAGTTAAIITIAVCATLFGVKEYTGSTVTGDDTSRGTLLKDIWEVCTFRPFADLVGLGMLSCFGTTLQQWSAAIAIQYAHGLEDQVQNLLLALLGASVLTIPVAALLLTRFEKKLVLAGFALLVAGVSVGMMYIPAGRLDILLVMVCLVGIGFAGPTYIPWTMLTDVADDFKIQKGKRRDMLFQTLFQSLNITSILLASVTSIVALEIGGYQSGACTQADSVAFTTRLLVSFIPAGATLLSLVFLWRYQLTGERLAANKAVLEERRTQQAADTNVNGAAPQLSLTMKSHDEPDTRGPVQLTYFGPHGSFRVKHH